MVLVAWAAEMALSAVPLLPATGAMQVRAQGFLLLIMLIAQAADLRWPPYENMRPVLTAGKTAGQALVVAKVHLLHSRKILTMMRTEAGKKPATAFRISAARAWLLGYIWHCRY